MSGTFPRAVLGLIAFAAALVTAAPAHAVSLSSSFDSNNQEWQVGYDPVTGSSSPAFSPAAWTATGGNPTGHLVYSPIDEGGGFYQAGYFRSPAAWSGDALQNYGGSFQFDAKTNGAPDGPPIVYLFRGTLPLGDEQGESAIVSALDEPIQSTWSHYSIPLNPADWRDLSGQPADEHTFRHVLHGLDGALVSVERHSSVLAPDHDSSEQGALDNPALEGGSSPAPVSYERELSIRYKTGAFRGLVTSDAPLQCAASPVTVYRKKKRGPDRVIGEDETDEQGAYEVSAAKRPGKYYARIPQEQFGDEELGLSCKAVKSPVKKLR